MPIDSLDVALILDPDFDGDLLTIASSMPVWMVESPTNDKSMESVWRHVSHAEESRVTRFLVMDSRNVEDLFARALYAIDEHHGPVSCDPPYQRLTVYGAPVEVLTSELAEELSFVSIVKTDFGFIASKQGSLAGSEF